jgi:hypothetical protein
MTRDEVAEMAREAGLPLAWVSEEGVLRWSELERFAALVVAAVYENEDMFTEAYAGGFAAGAAAEREACAKVAESGNFLHDDSPEARFGKACAAAIRRRGEK